jgi:hypothetical protein
LGVESYRVNEVVRSHRFHRLSVSLFLHYLLALREVYEIDHALLVFCEFQTNVLQLNVAMDVAQAM